MEFISAKDLPVSEAEEVDVLCVDNGEMKRKPASGIGGNSKYIATIKEREFWNPELNGGEGDWEVTLEFVGEHPTFEEFVAMAQERVAPKLLTLYEKVINTDDEYYEECTAYEVADLYCVRYRNPDSGEIAEQVKLAGNYALLPDGTLDWG